MTDPWRLDPWIPCGKHLFLSHASEDSSTLAIPVYEALQKRQIIAWGDFKEGRLLAGEAPLPELRQALIRCRHVVYLLTPDALLQNRGWMAAERDMADHLQQLLRVGNQNLFDVELALLLPDGQGEYCELTHVERSVWDRLKPQKILATEPAEQIEEVVTRISDFLQTQLASSRDLFTNDLLQRIEIERADFGLHTDQDFIDRLSGASPFVSLT